MMDSLVIVTNDGFLSIRFVFNAAAGLSINQNEAANHW